MCPIHSRDVQIAGNWCRRERSLRAAQQVKTQMMRQDQNYKIRIPLLMIAALAASLVRNPHEAGPKTPGAASDRGC